jgi:hypothetical protein
MPLLPDSVRYSESLGASPAELIEAVREQGFEGIVAKRRDSLTELLFAAARPILFTLQIQGSPSRHRLRVH